MVGLWKPTRVLPRIEDSQDHGERDVKYEKLVRTKMRVIYVVPYSNKTLHNTNNYAAATKYTLVAHIFILVSAIYILNFNDTYNSDDHKIILILITYNMMVV